MNIVKNTISVGVLFLFIGTFNVQAQRIFKCADGTYTQTRCANNEVSSEIHYNPRSASSPRNESIEWQQHPPSSVQQRSVGTAISSAPSVNLSITPTPATQQNLLSAPQRIRDLARDPVYRQFRSSRQAAAHALAQGADQATMKQLRDIAGDRAYEGHPTIRREAMNAVMRRAGLQDAGPYQP